MEKTSSRNFCSEGSSRSKLNVDTARQHEELLHQRKKRFDCKVCGYEGSQRESQLINHMRKHTGERPFKCTVKGCEVAFKLNAALKNHINYKHSDDRPLKCKVPGCLYTAKTTSTLIDHRKTHTVDRPFACPTLSCNFRAKERKKITLHVATAHIKAKRFPCSMCDFKTFHNSYLKLHMRRHSIRRDFKCSHPQCIESFKTLHGLRRHSSYHREQRSIKCNHPGCGRNYVNAEALDNHEGVVHATKSHACPNLNCSYTATTDQILARHVIAHDRRIEKMRLHKAALTCPVTGCGQYSFTKKSLNDHMRLHNPSIIHFKCALCFKIYTSLSGLQGHIPVHTNEKPFKCGHCEYETGNRPAMKTHISSVHTNLKFPFIKFPRVYCPLHGSCYPSCNC